MNTFFSCCKIGSFYPFLVPFNPFFDLFLIPFWSLFYHFFIPLWPLFIPFALACHGCEWVGCQMVGPLARTRELEPRATVELGALRRRSGATEANSEKPSGQLFKQTFTFSRKIWKSCSTLVIWWFPGGNGTSKLAICDYFRLDSRDFLQAF